MQYGINAKALYLAENEYNVAKVSIPIAVRFLRDCHDLLRQTSQ